MFSSIASFLPSLRLPNSNSGILSPTQSKFEPTDTPEEEEAYRNEPIEEETNVKKSKTRSVNETFIIVRPPPAKSNHPLNLQVQLVPPAARNTRQSVDESDAGNSNTTSVPLTRTASNRSDTSSYGSTASFSSTTSVSSARRTIIPLYSLQAHNVLTNTIVDAGTDAKIAKFLRRGLELIDLAMLEPVEVWSDRRRSTQVLQPTPVIRTSRPASPDGVHNTTAESSVVSLTPSANHQTTTPTGNPIFSIPTGLSAPVPSSSKRNLFGKIFKKKDNSLATPPTSPSRFPPSTSPVQSTKTLTPDPSTTPTAQSRGHSRNISATLSPASITDKLRHRSSSPNARALGLGLLQVPSLEDQSNHNSNGSAITRTGSFLDEDTPVPPLPHQNDEGKTEGRILRPPVLGIQPTLSYSYSPTAGGVAEPLPAGSLSKSARALMYVWFVKRWYKRREDDPDNGGLLGMVQHSRASSGQGRGFTTTGAAAHVAGEGVEVRFEWKRNSTKARARKGRGRKGKQGEEMDGEVERGKTPKERIRDKDKLSHRISTISHQSVSTSEDGRDRSESLRGSNIRNRYDEEDMEDSDPEDSETPWTCTLKIRRSGTGTKSRQGSTIKANSGQDELGFIPPDIQVLRLKVGTLSPTPHHPKVLGMLKVPFPLPDVEVERMGAVRRPTDREAYPHYTWEGLTLTAEEIKDVVCSTAMWLTVREGFGGVGKVSRKGDGWRIRA